MIDKVDQALETIRREIEREVWTDALKAPFVSVSNDKRGGWIVSMNANCDAPIDAPYFALIELMKASLDHGWEDTEMEKAIQGLERLLKYCKKEYKQYKGPQPPNQKDQQ